MTAELVCYEEQQHMSNDSNHADSGGKYWITVTPTVHTAVGVS